MKSLATRHVGILACFFLMALANCGGGGGGGGSDSGGVVAVFTPSCVIGDPCYSSSVTLQPGASSGSTFTVDVVLNKLNTVIGGAGLIVTFDATKVQYQDYSEGPALGGGATYIVTPMSGQVDVSIAVAAGKSLSSSAVAITLVFKALKAGQANLDFLDKNINDGTALYKTDESVLLPVAWSGGLLTAS